MAGGFINTKYVDTIESLSQATREKINNPYYMYTDKKPTVCTYYNIDLKRTSTDESLGTVYSDIGANSPIKYNLIDDFILYGLPRIEADFEYNDMKGITSALAEGEAYILPNTIIPVPSDYFMVKFNGIPFMFKVTNVTSDTVDNGANFYKITWKLDKPDNGRILNKINKRYKMIVDNVGTQFNTIIRDCDYDLADRLQTVSIALKGYYKNLFYNSGVQTFTLFKNGYYFYDPYLIEFLIRNKILDGDIHYMKVTQQLALDGMFYINYDRTFFRMFETKNTQFDYMINAQSKYIDQPLSILCTRREDYQEVYYITNTDENCIVNRYILPILELDFYNHLKNKEEYDYPTYRNIIIRFIKGEPIVGDDINLINNIQFEYNMQLMYEMPMLILAFDSAISQLLTSQTT